MHRNTAVRSAALVWVAMAVTGAAYGADINVVCTPALAPALPALVSEFERVSGHTVAVTYGTAGAIRDRIERGKTADVAISTAPVIDELERHGRIDRGARVDVARVGIGVQVRSGAPKPHIRSVDAFRRAILGAKSIGYIDPAGGGAAGIHVARVMERLGIAERVAPKTQLVGGTSLIRAVADGEVELGLAPISEILSDSRVELVGPLPNEVQDVTVLVAGLVTGSKARDAAKAFIDFLTTPAAVAAMKGRGLQ